MTPEERAEIHAQLADAQPATEDPFCMNLSAYRGDRVAPDGLVRRVPGRSRTRARAYGGRVAVPIRPENRDRYPADWPEISRRIRTERAAGRCECEGECGRGTHSGRCPNRNGSPAYGTGSYVVLTVAHLDHTPEHCDDSNLRAMCQGCHLHYDREHHRETAAATRRAALEAGGQLAITTTDRGTQMPTEIEIRFDPPADPLPTQQRARQEIALALREFPGQWVLIGAVGTPGRARSHAYELRRGGSGWEAFGSGFEAEMHHMLGESRIYARYVGTAAPAGGDA